MEPEIKPGAAGSSEKPTELPTSASFESIVESSKAKIAQETEEQIKRGRGRPHGTTKEAIAAKKAGGDQSSTADGSKKSDGSPASVLNLTEELKPIVQDAVKVPFSLAAAKFEEPEIELSDKDAAVSSRYLANFVKHALPDLEKLGPIWFNLWAFVISYGILILKKFPLVAKKKAKLIAARETRAEAPASESQGTNTTTTVADPQWESPFGGGNKGIGV